MRVSWKRYRPEDSHMQATVGTSILSKLLVAAPFLVMASIGAKSRSSASTFDFVACSPKEDQQISAYTPVVTATETQVTMPMHTDPGLARRLAYRWIEGQKVGLLQPLEPCSFDDSSRDGIKAEIVHADISVAEAMNSNAEREAFAGSFDTAAKDAMLAADTLEVTKFFDFASLTTCTMVQRRSLNIIKYVEPKLSPEVRSQVLHEIKAFRANDDRLGQMAINARQELLKYELRHGVDLLSIEQTQKEVGQQEFRNVASLEAVIKAMRDGIRDSRDDFAPTLFTDVRLGFISQLDTDRRIDAILQEAKPTGTL